MRTLDRLADHYGIEPYYHDVWGTRHQISPETKAAILKALGLRTDTEAEACEELRRAHERLWQRPLPPVVVCAADEPISVRVSIAATLREVPIEWHLRTESGREWRGSFSCAELELLEETDLDREHRERYLLALPALAETGYHRLELQGRLACSTDLIVCPSRCYAVTDAVGDERVWGLSLQLYGLQSASNWGIGDFSDLAAFAGSAAGYGASLVGVNPLHALFPAEPRHFSPYSPSSREFLNPLYIDAERLADLEDCRVARQVRDDPAFAQRKDEARRAALVDYVAVSDMKMAVLEGAYACFRERELDGSGQPSPRGEAFRAFQRRIGPSLRRHALFEALHEHFYCRAAAIWSWRNWPEPYRDCGSAEVERFEQANLPRIEFFEYLQWQAEEQLADAQRRSLESGMPFGLYCDLAVAVQPDGASAWCYPQALVSEASVGAPPDDLGPDGQNWGLAPLSPVGLQESAYAPFIAALRANMRHAGALRIDHVMGLQRLFWIPQGMHGSEGAYVRYPLHDLLRIIALESQRNRCIVIGEDLGTVAEGFREALQAAGVLSYKVLLFEREADDSFRRPDAYPTEALVTASTHDLPTLAGYRAGRDLEWRRQLGQYAEESAAQVAKTTRARSAAMLDAALEELMGTEVGPATGPHLYLARTSCRVLMVQAEDLLGELEQPNLPGTHDEHPNWRRKLSMPLEDIFENDATRSLLSQVAEARPRAPKTV